MRSKSSLIVALLTLLGTNLNAQVPAKVFRGFIAGGASPATIAQTMKPFSSEVEWRIFGDGEKINLYI